MASPTPKALRMGRHCRKITWYRVTTVQQGPIGPGPIPAGFSEQEVEHLTEALSLLIG